MRPVDARARETRDWLRKAAEDIASCRALIVSGHFGNALFFCQQAEEKSLKGFLTWHDRTFRRPHDLEELGEACCAPSVPRPGSVGRPA
jgi:HEPN domain-containing protein